MSCFRSVAISPPGPSATPADSRPSPAVSGRRPIAHSTQSNGPRARPSASDTRSRRAACARAPPRRTSVRISMPSACMAAISRVESISSKPRSIARVAREQRDAAAERGEDAAQFRGDVTAADDRDGHGQPVERKETVRGDAERGTRKRRAPTGRAAGRDDDMARSVGLAADLDLARGPRRGRSRATASRRCARRSRGRCRAIFRHKRRGASSGPQSRAARYASAKP